MTPGYSALLHGAGLIDLSSRGRIRVTGEDRARLLHAMTTNHVQQLKPGEALYAFFLNANGRILADAFVICYDDHLLLDTEPQSRQVVYEHLDRFIIADDATLDDITDQTFCLSVEGPKALEIAEGLGYPVVSATGARAVRLYGPVGLREETVQRLEGRGAIAVADAEADAARLRNYKPRFGVDFSEATLPQETQQMHALHFQKGCYLGQEIVERIRSRGHVNKQLMGFHAAGDRVPGKGDSLAFNEKESGEVTSAVRTPEGDIYGLAMVRVPHNKPGAQAEIGGIPAQLFAPYSAELS